MDSNANKRHAGPLTETVSGESPELSPEDLPEEELSEAESSELDCGQRRRREAARNDKPVEQQRESKGIALSKEKQREIHNMVERMRRYRISSCIANIAERIPNLGQDKLDKASVLDTALRYLKYIRNTCANIRLIDEAYLAQFGADRPGHKRSSRKPAGLGSCRTTATVRVEDPAEFIVRSRSKSQPQKRKRSPSPPAASVINPVALQDPNVSQSIVSA
ncbi:hypothetical protein BV898_04178 [Hypsibius exemplaris]|uniref:BHLH domain-containing protein n=1 Tax=Hypsibius exemplaris TaxID=2072580 RepID=A0A1W0X338_HYPEX|nr:hypothetical protein BV898_04178 [Hypsibius exemplaris]